MKTENKHILDTDTFYDIEALHNIFTMVTYTPAYNHINVFYHVEPDSDIDMLVQKTENIYELIISHIKKENKTFFKNHNININIGNLKQWVKQSYKQLTNENEDFPVRMFGFNSHAYDEAMLAFLLEKGRDGDLPRPSNLRKFSDKLINVKNVYDAFENDYTLKEFYKGNMRYTNPRLFIDIKDLNEKLRFVSLKRLSAQAGLKIKESQRLSGDNAVVDTIEDITELLAYNTVDTINTQQIFNFPEYLTPFTQRSDLLERYKENYIGRLGPDSTSAKFIEHVIVPAKEDKRQEKALVDDTRINTFYPINISNNDELTNAREHIINNDLSEEEANQYLIDTFDLNSELPRYRYNKERKLIEEDLLEMAKEDYDLPDAIYEMYDYVRGERSLNEARTKLFNDGIVEKVGKSINVSKNQLVRNSNSYITFSVGGCHGEYVDRENYLKHYHDVQNKNKEIKDFNENLALLQETYSNDEAGATEYLMTKKDGTTPAKFEHLEHKKYVTGSYKNGAKWKKAKKEKSDFKLRKEMKKFAKTIYAENIGHGDVDSLYPTLMTNLGMFSKILPDGTIHDPYAELLHERLALKAELEAVPKSEWTEREKLKDRIQKLNKLLLNAASGVADASFDNNIRVNNKTVRMRICGQLILSCLVYKLTDAGSTAISTNTDGVYFTSLPEDITKEIFDTWCEYFNINATPETIDLFITKDSNNRLEIDNGNVLSAAGTTISLYNGPSLSNFMSLPIIKDNSLVDYLKNIKEPLAKFDESYIRQRLQNIINWGKENDPVKTLELFQWFFVSNPSKNSFMTPIDTNTDELVEHGKTFRGFIVKESPITMKCIKITKENKNTESYAQQIAEDNHLINSFNENNHIKFGKINNLPEDNKVEIHQEQLEDINPNLLDRIDLDVYINVIKDNWESWSDRYKIITKDMTVLN